MKEKMDLGDFLTTEDYEKITKATRMIIEMGDVNKWTPIIGTYACINFIACIIAQQFEKESERNIAAKEALKGLKAFVAAKAKHRGTKDKANPMGLLEEVAQKQHREEMAT